MNLHAMVMEHRGVACKEYLRIHLRLPLVTRIGPLARSFDFVASAAPGVREILVVGKLAYEVAREPLRHRDRRRVGHRPRGRSAGVTGAIHDLVRVGLVREQTDWMLDILHDPAVTGTVDRGRPRGDAGHRDRWN